MEKLGVTVKVKCMMKGSREAAGEGQALILIKFLLIHS